MKHWSPQKPKSFRPFDGNHFGVLLSVITPIYLMSLLIPGHNQMISFILYILKFLRLVKLLFAGGQCWGGYLLSHRRMNIVSIKGGKREESHVDACKLMQISECRYVKCICIHTAMSVHIVNELV